MLDQNVVHMSLSTVQGRVRPISGNRCCSGGPRISRFHQRAPRVRRVLPVLPKGAMRPPGETKIVPDGLQGLGILMMSWARARRKASLGLGRFNAVNTLGWVCLLLAPDK
jgi:hypothetical protein